MIEAINSTLVTASVTQKAAVQAYSKPIAAETKVQDASLKTEGFYFSRNVRVDNNSNVAVLEFRNPLNGDVKTQIPTEAQLKAYEVAEIRNEALLKLEN
jgi:hypothetical protein